MKKAQEAGIFDIRFLDIRQFSDDPHRQVDHYPYGGKQGMLLRTDILQRAIESIDCFEEYRLIYTCPKGELFSQGHADAFSKEKGLVLICGYYEGVDERLFSLFPIQRVSVGNVVLSSGEFPALLIAEAVLRLLPGVVGNEKSVRDDSLMNGLLEGPQYTAPREIAGFIVPEVLLSGHHANVQRWQRKQALRQTLYAKPELLQTAILTHEDQLSLVEILKEV